MIWPREPTPLLPLDPGGPRILSEPQSETMALNLVQAVVEDSFIQVHDNGNLLTRRILDLVPDCVLSHSEGLPAKICVLVRFPYPTDVVGEFVVLTVHLKL